MDYLMRQASTFMRFATLLFYLVALTASFTTAKDTYYLGFLAPFPTSTGDSLIPSQLAQQWQSAFQVALEVLNAGNRSYQLEAVLADTECNWMKVLTLSHVLDQKNLIGLVGPACSGAAIAAVQYFKQNSPIVSFAATHESLSNRNNYPNFFRIVYGDKYQALTLLSVMEKLDIWNATIICAKDYYSLSLGSYIQEVAIERILSMEVLDISENSSVSVSQVKDYLQSLNASNVVILAVPPLVARDFWTVAVQMGKTTSPWWYLGSDGVTAFDPVSDDPSMAQALQGEIGLAPQGGDATTLGSCQKYYDHWKEKAYPGLPAVGLNESRSYVTHVIDTVALYFEIVDALVMNNVSVNASSVLSALQGSGPGSPSFSGCTGNVQIDPETGSRRVSASQPAAYNFVSLGNSSWELKGQLHNATFTSFQPVTRPAVTVDVHAGPAKKRNGGLVAGLVLFFVGLVVLLAVVIVFVTRRRNRSKSFVRMRG